MSELLKKHLDKFPPEFQQEIQHLQKDSEMLRYLCQGDPGHDLEVLRRTGRAIMTYLHQVDFTEQYNHREIGDMLLHFYDQLGDVYAYSSERFGTTMRQLP